MEDNLGSCVSVFLDAAAASASTIFPSISMVDCKPASFEMVSLLSVTEEAGEGTVMASVP